MCLDGGDAKKKECYRVSNIILLPAQSRCVEHLAHQFMIKYNHELPSEKLYHYAEVVKVSRRLLK